MLALVASADAVAQQKQKVAYRVDAKDATYPQRHVLDVGDQPGHQVNVFEIHRKFAGDGPVVNGIRLKEIWTRGYGDYVDSNGLSVNYSIYVGENGDKFYSMARTMGTAEAGKRSTVSVGELRGGIGKFAGIKGITRAKGASEGAKGYNSTDAEIEYWFEK
jgi:hypothetical protein